MRFIYTKSFAIFFGTLIIATILVFFHYKGWLKDVQGVILNLPRPVSFLVHKTIQPVKSFFSSVFTLKNIVIKNKFLEEELIDLKTQLVLAQSLALENERLRKELDFKHESKLDLEPCTVIGRSPTGFTDSLVINCGEKNGAEPGRAVISRGFLAGKITYTTQDFSTVQLITNSSFSVDARLSQTGRLAIARGSYNSGLILDQIPSQFTLEKGMLVVTAGVNDKIPKNIIIGEVGDMLTNQNDLFSKATLTSPIDFGDLEFVFLVK